VQKLTSTPQNLAWVKSIYDNVMIVPHTKVKLKQALLVDEEVITDLLLMNTEDANGNKSQDLYTVQNPESSYPEVSKLVKVSNIKGRGELVIDAEIHDQLIVDIETKSENVEVIINKLNC
jgi:hypothetical protein